MEAVAARDDVAREFDLLAVVRERDRRRARVDVAHRDVTDLEQQRSRVREPRLDQVLDHLLLSVDDDRTAGRVFGEVDPVALAAEAQFDAVMLHAFAVQPVRDARIRQHVDGALFEDAGPHAMLDVVAVAVLEHDRFDPRAVQQVGEQQPGGARADDSDLRAHPHGWLRLLRGDGASRAFRLAGPSEGRARRAAAAAGRWVPGRSRLDPFGAGADFMEPLRVRWILPCRCGPPRRSPP